MAHIIKNHISEKTTTTGTGPFALSGVSSPEMRTFASECAVGDTFRGVIEAVDASGTPTGDWQSGTFTYSAANQVSTLVVEESSNANAAVSFAAGTKRVWIGLTAKQAGWIRERLTANRTYYVRSDGSDSNDGLADTAGGAFLTIPKAIDVIADTLDIQGYAVKIKVGDGTRTTPLVARQYVGSGTVTIEGNTTTPGNCVISTTSAACFTNASNRYYELKGFKLQTTTSGRCIEVSGGGSYVAYSDMDFGAAASSHMNVSFNGRLVASGNYTISGSATSHCNVVEGGGFDTGGRTVTLTGTPNFSVAFLYMRNNGMALMQSMTFSGSATGSRFSINLNSTCFTNGSAEASYLPGNSAGTKATGGEYA